MGWVLSALGGLLAGSALGAALVIWRRKRESEARIRHLQHH